MQILFALSIVAAAAISMIRLAILFPRDLRPVGWRASLFKYKWSIAFLIIFITYEIGNLTGFSWDRGRYVSNREIVDAAVERAYSGIYSDAENLKKDYPGFAPVAEYWGNWFWSEGGSNLLNKLLGYTVYQVRLPGEVVIVDTSGRAEYSRSCGTGSAYCDLIPPFRPELGVVGTVQLGEPNYEVAKNIGVTWSDNKGSVFVAGHCFSALSESANGQRLSINIPEDGRSLSIGDLYGFYLVAITAGKQGSYYGILRISKDQFIKSRSCSKDARAKWPNVGGGAWKR
jgi:hypothetical protein